MGGVQAKLAELSEPSTEDTLVVSEVFGPTFQGEGPNLGRLAAFIRLGGCNLSCSWCDTPYTWDATRHNLRKELQRLDYKAILRTVAGIKPQLVVITGGEPLLWQGKPGWTKLLWNLSSRYEVEVETNGTVAPNDHTLELVSHFDVSPKLANAGMPKDKRLDLSALRTFANLARTNRACAKFVATSPDDLDEITTLVDRVRFPRRRVYIMPEGTTTAKVLSHARALAKPVMHKGFNMTTRLHVLLWGNERGR